MAKGKSSATSKTRKKHERKAAGPADELPPNPKDKKPKQRGQKKAKKEERVKVFIPPVKPSPVRPDPLETTGLGHRLPPDLLVVLRGLAKKDVVTKTRALEELQVGWVDKVLKGEDEEEKENVLYALGEMTPVWVRAFVYLYSSTPVLIDLSMLLYYLYALEFTNVTMSSCIISPPCSCTPPDAYVSSQVPCTRRSSGFHLSAMRSSFLCARTPQIRRRASSARGRWRRTISIAPSRDLSVSRHGSASTSRLQLKLAWNPPRSLLHLLRSLLPWSQRRRIQQTSSSWTRPHFPL